MEEKIIKAKFLEILKTNSGWMEHYSTGDLYVIDSEDFDKIADELVKLFTVQNASKRTLGINRVANIIKSMPTDQAIQQLKSELTGKPITEVIEGDLVVTYVW